MEDDFQLHNQALYDLLCTAIENSVIDISSQFRINLRSALNQSHYLYVIEGLPSDATHDVLQGVSSIWSQRTPQISIDEQQSFTLGNLNCWIKNLVCGYPDVSSKPCVISSATLNSNTNSLKQKVKLTLLVVHRKWIKLCVGNSVDHNVILASERWCLGRFLP